LTHRLAAEEVEHHLGNPAVCATLGVDTGLVSRNNEFKALMGLKTKLSTLLAGYPSEAVRVLNSC
jgi:hypothetical protein